MQVNVKLPSWKALWKVGLGMALLAGLIVGAAVVFADNGPAPKVRVVTPGGDESPYVCFVAVQGETKVLAMDCIDISLTERESWQDLITRVNNGS